MKFDTWNIENASQAGSDFNYNTLSNNEVAIYIYVHNTNWASDSSAQPSVTINWGDGVTETTDAWWDNGITPMKHTYTNTSPKTVTLTGDLAGFSCNTVSEATIIGMKSIASCYKMFSCPNVTVSSQQGLNRFDLKSLDLSQFDSSNVTSISHMFENQDLSILSDTNGAFNHMANFSSKKITDAEKAFRCHKYPKKLDLEHLHMDLVENTVEMFKCQFWDPALEELKISTWNLPNLKFARNTFDGWIHPPDIKNWVTPRLQNFNVYSFSTYWTAHGSAWLANKPTSWGSSQYMQPSWW